MQEWWEELERLIEQDLDRETARIKQEASEQDARIKPMLEDMRRNPEKWKEVFSHRPELERCMCDECFKKRWKSTKLP